MLLQDKKNFVKGEQGIIKRTNCKKGFKAAKVNY